MIEIDDLVAKIVCAHPYSVKRHLNPCEVSPLDCQAVIEAAEAEMRAAHCTELEALTMILGRVTDIADQVPRHRWRFIKNPAAFFRSFDYRLVPEDFMDENAIQPGVQPQPSEAEIEAQREWFRARGRIS